MSFFMQLHLPIIRKSRKRLLGKYIAGVVSSGSGQAQEVLDYIKYYGHTCGAQYSGGVSSAAQSIGERTEEAIRLGRKLAMDIQEKRNYPEQLKLIENGKQHFRLIIEARKKEWAGRTSGQPAISRVHDFQIVSSLYFTVINHLLTIIYKRGFRTENPCVGAIQRTDVTRPKIHHTC